MPQTVVSKSGPAKSQIESDDLDHLLIKVEGLYRHITGAEPPPLGEGQLSEIPPEKDPVVHVERQLDRLLGMLGPTGAEPCWVPAISVAEGPLEYLIETDIAGVPRTGVRVAVSNNAVVISGERPASAAAEVPLRLVHSERPAGPFRRAVALPDDANRDQISARIHDGVLTVRAPRTGPGVATTKNITIE